MANLQVSTVTKSYGSKRLFEDVTVNFTAGKRYGLTGPNGAGKSTVDERIAAVATLTREQWAFGGLPLPRYARSEMPGRIIRRPP